MSLQSKIEIYDTSNTLIHTITNEAFNIHTHDILTSGVGTFNFSLPYNNNYTDIVGNWKVLIYLGTAPDLVFAGKIKRITGPLNSKDGYLRTYEGKALGEVLERRFKFNKRYQNVAANAITAEIASDLGLSSNIDTDTTQETVTVRTESYFDMLKQISDYWSSGATQVQEDFGIGTNGLLFWQPRPLRSAGVETLTLGTNILSFLVTRDYTTIRNNIIVYGAPNSYYPADKDYETENHSANWTAVSGTTLTHNNTPAQVGTYFVYGRTTNASTADFYVSIGRQSIRDISKLSFLSLPSWNTLFHSGAGHVRILCPDSSNYFEATIAENGTNWILNELSLGDANVYNAVTNPSGKWTSHGAPNWWDMEAVEFIVSGAYDSGLGSYNGVSIDSLFFSPVRCQSVVGTDGYDAASIASYGQTDAEYTDENILSVSECTKRANTLLYQLKEPVIRLDLSTNGNSNIKIGDRIQVTIPPENLTNANFDLISVDHDWTPSGWVTKTSGVNTADVRQLPVLNPSEFFQRQINNVKDVAAEIYSRVIGR